MGANAVTVQTEIGTVHHITKANHRSNPMNAKERKKLARAIAHRFECMRDASLEKSIATALTGCSARIYKATMPIPIRSKEQPSADNICLPEVAMFAAGHRKSECLTAR